MELIFKVFILVVELNETSNWVVNVLVPSATRVAGIIVVNALSWVARLTVRNMLLRFGLYLLMLVGLPMNHINDQHVG